MDLKRAIQELECETGDDGFVDPGKEPLHEPTTSSILSAEDTNRLKQLQRIARCSLGPRRNLIVGSAAMIERLATIKAEAPHFATFVDFATRAARMSARTGSPMQIPPTLLIGAPGIGKTFVLKRIAKAIGNEIRLLSMNTLDSFRLRGLNTAWKGARMGKIAEALLESTTASPVILLDEFEKIPQTGLDRPFDPFLSFFEEENSERFVDDFLEIPLKLDHVIWVASANSTVGIPAPILDRLLVIEIPTPTGNQLAQIIDGIYATVRERCAARFSPHLAGDIRHLLAQHNPRRLKRIIALAIGYAASDDRDELTRADVERALELAEHASTNGHRYPIGFMRGSD